MIVLLQGIMPKLRAHTPEDLADAAMHVFWQYGYEATSLDDLVRATGVSRHGIYGDFGNKHDLFLACLKHYEDVVVSPAFSQVEANDADLSSVRDYFHHQIKRAEEVGLPGPGCLMANTLTELAPHEGDIEALVRGHQTRLRNGFLSALKRTAPHTSRQTRQHLSHLLVIFAQGLWSASRVETNAHALRQSVKTMLNMVQRELLR